MCVHEFVMSRLLHFYLEITDDGWLVNVIGKYIFLLRIYPLSNTSFVTTYKNYNFLKGAVGQRGEIFLQVSSSWLNRCGLV